MKKTKIKTIVQTAILIALLVVIQYVTSSFGQIVTGTAVNFILIASVLLVSIPSGITVAIISPFVAKLIGIGPAIIWLVPVISIGNALLVLIYGMVFSKSINMPNILRWIISIIIGSLLKFASLYLIIVKLILPLLSLNNAMVTKLSAMFSLPQLITAVSGGILALLVIPMVKKAINK